MSSKYGKNLQPVYSDINVNNESAEAPLIYNIDAIKQSLGLLFNTCEKDRMFNRSVGLSFEDLLFQQMDVFTEQKIFSRLMMIEAYEPRIKLLPQLCSVTADPTNNRFIIYLTFRILGLGKGTFDYTGELAK